MRRAKNPAPHRNDFEDSFFLQEISSVQKHLLKELGPHSPFAPACASPERLANVLYDLQSYMERTLGAKSAYPRLMCKFPASVFKEIRVDGSVHVLLRIVFEYAKNCQWQVSDLTFGATAAFNEVGEKASAPTVLELAKEARRKEQRLGMLSRAERALVSSGYINTPRVFFNPDIPAPVLKEVRDIAIAHSAVIVTKASEATHRVFFDSEVDTKARDDGEDYMRPLEIRPAPICGATDEKTGMLKSGLARVHWWYYPDSYDQWINSTEVDASDPPEALGLDSASGGSSKGWVVNCRFLRDLKYFNEWGNEVDYEKDGDEDEFVEGGKGSSKKSKGKTADTKRKREAVVAEALPVFDKLDTNVTQLSSTQQGKVTTVSAKDSHIIISTSEEEGISSAEIKEEADERDKKRSRLDASDMNGLGKLPSWFHPTMVHAYEHKHLSEFFNNSSVYHTPHEYLRIRNNIVHLYAEAPTVFLSATSCRRKLTGDVGAILRVHAFLDAFEVINYNVEVMAKPRIAFLPLYEHERGEALANTDAATNKLGDAKTVAALASTFTPEMDKILLESVLQFDGNWSQVAVAVDGVVSSNGVKKAHSITPVVCMTRFAVLPLDGVTAIGSLSTSTSTSTSTGADSGLDMDLLASIFGGAPSAKLRVAMSGLSRQLILSQSKSDNAGSVNGYEVRASRAVGAALRELKATGIGGDASASASISKGAITDNLALSASLSVSLSTAMMASGIQEAQSHQALSDALLSYVAHRLDVIEEKARLLVNLERSLDQERTRLASEKRDVQILRTQSASYNPNPNAAY